jgi:mRNA-degrading endonuclease RelE of RelBE toxin-antitoxin system
MSPFVDFTNSESGNGRLPARHPAPRRQLIRHLSPELKRSVKQAILSLSSNPFSGEPLLSELTGLWKYKVRGFRLIYEVDRKARLIRIFALGHRQEVYEELADRLREARRRK